MKIFRLHITSLGALDLIQFNDEERCQVENLLDDND